MPKLAVLSGKELCAILMLHGFLKTKNFCPGTRVRQRGSHVVMQLKTEATTITVPVPDHAEIRIGTLLSIIRQSGIPRSEFER